MKKFLFNVFKNGNASNKAILPELLLSDGKLLQLQLGEEDKAFKKLYSKVRRVGLENCDESTQNEFFNGVSAIMPQIVVNLSDYIGHVVVVRRELFDYFYNYIYQFGDNERITIGWHIHDTCVAISGMLKGHEDKSTIPINENTYITAVDIRLNDDSVLGNTIVVTPTIENLELN